MDDVVNCVKTAKVLCLRSPLYYPSLEEGLERVVDWGYGKGERGEWCAEVASEIIDEYTKEEEEWEGMEEQEIGRDGRFTFGIKGGGGQQQVRNRGGGGGSYLARTIYHI